MTWDIIESPGGRITHQELIALHTLLSTSSLPLHTTLAHKLDSLVSVAKQEHNKDIHRWENEGGPPREK